MSLALPAADVRDPTQCFEAFVRAARRLCSELGVHIDFADMDVEDLGAWDSVTRTLHIRESATMIDQLWLMCDLWWLLTVGPWATAGAIREPLLRLVPGPREPGD